MSALVSIIVPVYNIEKYIGNCIDSLVSQTYENLEIICIDDGSKDKSAEIIREYCKKDSRIVYVYQDNAGVSTARNRGLDIARGKYIMFADGDDYLHYQAVEILYNCIAEKKCGFVFAGAYNTEKLNEPMTEITSYKAEKSSAEFLFVWTDGNQLGRAIWGKIYSRECLDGIKFPIGITHGEDYYFIASIISKNNPEFYYVDKKLYYYFHRSSSVSYVSINENNLSEVDAIRKIADMDYQDGFMTGFTLTTLMNIILVYRTKAYGSAMEKRVNLLAKNVWSENKNRFLSCKQIDLKTKIMTFCFYHSRRLYELARMIKDPTMKDLYKNRKKAGDSDES